jgi:hypothetical protein
VSEAGHPEVSQAPWRPSVLMAASPSIPPAGFASPPATQRLAENTRRVIGEALTRRALDETDALRSLLASSPSTSRSSSRPMPWRAGPGAPCLPAPGSTGTPPASERCQAPPPTSGRLRPPGDGEAVIVLAPPPEPSMLTGHSGEGTLPVHMTGGGQSVA